MKKTRRILMLALTLMMVFTVMAVPASAAETLPAVDETTIIQPRAEPCPCGGGYVKVTDWGEWVSTGEENSGCVHGHRYSTDIIYERAGTQWMRCNRCGDGWYIGTVTQTSPRECHGYD